MLTYCTPSLVRLLGYTEEESLGRNAFEFVHAEDHALTKKTFAELLRSRGKVITIQTRVRHKEGSWRWVESVCMNLLDKPGVQAVVSSNWDIPDESGSLFSSLYASLRRQRRPDPAVALRTAQLEMIRAGG